MRIGTANIQNFPDHPPRQVAQDAATVAGNTTLCGLQEIQPREDTRVVRDVLGSDWWLVGKLYETPIIGRTDYWRVLDTNVVPFSRPRLPHPESVHGAVVSVVVRSRRRKHLPPFAVVNTHLVSGGYNGPRIPAVAQRWDVEWGMLRDECLRLYKDGLTVYVTGDLNNAHAPRIGSKALTFRWFTPDGAIDHVGELQHPESVRLTDPHHDHVPLNSDHDLHVVSGTLRHSD